MEDQQALLCETFMELRREVWARAMYVGNIHSQVIYIIALDEIPREGK